MFRIITEKNQKFSQSDPVLIRQFSKKLQSDPVLIRTKLASVLIQSDPVRAHLCQPYGVVRLDTAVRNQACQIGVIDAKFHKFGFVYRQLVSKIIVWLFGFFYSIFGFFGGSSHMLSVSDRCFGFLTILLKSDIYQAFLTVLGVFSRKLSGNP